MLGIPKICQADTCQVSVMELEKRCRITVHLHPLTSSCLALCNSRVYWRISPKVNILEWLRKHMEETEGTTYTSGLLLFSHCLVPWEILLWRMVIVTWGALLHPVFPRKMNQTSVFQRDKKGEKPDNNIVIIATILIQRGNICETTSFARDLLFKLAFSLRSKCPPRATYLKWLLKKETIVQPFLL